MVTNSLVAIIKKHIYVIGYPKEIGGFLAEMLTLEVFNATLNESMEFDPPF
jgi:hypothetical protein